VNHMLRTAANFFTRSKAGDPVNAGVSILTDAAAYWMPRFRGA
jgi:hypothetical protein